MVEPLSPSLSSDPSLPGLLYANLSSRGGTRTFIYGSARYGNGHGEIYVTVGGVPLWDAATYSVPVVARSYPFGFWLTGWGSSSYGGRNAFKDVKDHPVRGGTPNRSHRRLRDSSVPSAYCFVIADHATKKGSDTVLNRSPSSGGCGMYGGSTLYEFEPDELATNGSHLLQAFHYREPRGERDDPSSCDGPSVRAPVFAEPRQHRRWLLGGLP